MPHIARPRPRVPDGRRAGRTIAWALLVGVALSLLSSSAAGDPWDPDPQDYLSALEGWLENIPADRAEMFRCPELAGGTAGTPERPWFPPREPVTGHGRDDVDPPSTLPERVDLRGTQQSYNRRYEFAVDEGTIWFRANREETGIDEPWAPLDVPDCFDGHVAGVAADDDELIAIDDDGWIYTLDRILSDPEHFTWTMRWGPPFWTGSGHRLPPGVRDWDWSVISLLEDRSFRDDASNDHPIGEGKVSHIWVIDQDHRLVYIDPWLPRDTSYEMCAPHRGRFQAEALAASGSTVFVVGEHGDLFTRLYDFDIAGADPVFFSYSYEDQSDEANPDIQLPSPDWIQQPKIPGTITDRISIHKVGELSLHRTLRVEGRHQGRSGYWEKDITEDGWRFEVTDEELQGAILPNPRTDTSDRNLGPSRDRRYVGEADGAEIVVEDFHVACTPAQLTVHLDGERTLPLVLHSVDGLRQAERAPGLDDDPRWIQGTIEIPPAVRNAADAESRAWLDELGEDRFIQANLDVTSGEMYFRAQEWRLRYEPDQEESAASPVGGGTPAEGDQQDDAASEDAAEAVSGHPAGDQAAPTALPVTGGGVAVALGLTALAGALALRRGTT